MSTSPIQTSFAGGELSPDTRGRVDLDIYRRGLARCENFKVRPRGSLVRRAGSVFVRSEGVSANDVPRLIPFRVAGSADDYVLAIADGRLRVLSVATGALVNLQQNKVVNGHFDANITSWPGSGGASWSNGTLRLTDVGGGLTYAAQVNIPVTAGQAHTLRFRARRVDSISNMNVLIDGVVNFISGLSKAWKWYSYAFTPAGATSTVRFEELAGINEALEVDDVTVTQDGATVTELVAPWTADQLADLQWDAEPVANRVVIVHPAVQPHVIAFTAPATWEIYPASFASQPAEWGTDNWPSAVEVGFQGRMWFGGTPNEPHTFWGSRSGKAFDFTTGANPGDAVSWIMSTKGALRWMRGQRVMLIGSEVAEHAVTSSSGLITPSDVDIRDESAFGSGAVQALSLGDEVVFASRDGRTIRALSFDAQTRDGWVASALTFFAEHLLEDFRVKELHFGRSPDPVLLVLTDVPAGETRSRLYACTYDRGAQVVAWWRIDVGGTVHSAAIADGSDGSELWIAVTRAAGAHLVERMPMHEVGAVYLDSALTFQSETSAPADGLATNFPIPASWDVGATIRISTASARFKAGDVGRDMVIGLDQDVPARVRVTAFISAAQVDAEILEPVAPAIRASLEAGTLAGGNWKFAWSLIPVAHLDGETVGILADGALEQNQVVSGGTVELDHATDEVTVGLPYLAKATTLPREVKTGKARDVKIGALLSNSALPLLNGKRAADRTPSTPQDQPEALRTGRCQVANLGWSDDGAVTIEQDLPFRTEVLAVFAVTAVERI